MKRNFEFTALVDNAIFSPAWPPSWTEGKIIPSISVLLIISEEIVSEIRYSLLSVTIFENSLLIKRIRSYSWSVKSNFLNTSLKSLSSLLFCTSGNVESATKEITLKGLITSQ